MEQEELRAAGRLYAIWLAYLPTDPWGLKGKAELELLAGTVIARLT